MTKSFTLRVFFNPGVSDHDTAAVRPAAGPAMLLFVLLTACALLAPLRAQGADLAGKIVSIDSGEAPAFVNILRLGRDGYLQAGTGASVLAGDTVKTGAGVRAQIELSDQSLINLSPKSSVQMKGYLLEPATAKRSYVLKTLKGAVRFIISKALKSAGKSATRPWQKSDVYVETCTAIAGIRGTDFVVTSMTEGAAPVVEIAVFEGSVQVRSMSLSIREAVTLMANQVSSVQRRSAPRQPAPLSPQRRDALLQSTTSSRPPRAQAAAPAAQAASVADETNYTQQDLTRDLAAGMPIADALDLAATAGLSVEQMMSAANDADVDPYALVSTAVTEGYPVEAVVTAAIQNGAALNEVFAAAATAGGETTSIIDGATGAGVSPESAATTITDVSNAAPGTVPPSTETTSVETTVPSDPVAVSGGGGETPSTLPASPYIP